MNETGVAYRPGGLLRDIARGTVDAAFSRSSGQLPRVIFDGEDDPTAEGLQYCAGVDVRAGVPVLLGLYHTGWVILGVIDGHSDVAHVDVAAYSLHTDGGPHTDVTGTHTDNPNAHADQHTHADVPGDHTDENPPHTDDHTDQPAEHTDVGHSDDPPHSDTFSDNHTDFADAGPGHVDHHIDSGHSDDPPHSDGFTDDPGAHVDTGHSDDPPHTDEGGHSDDPDAEHVDGTAHVDTTPHTDEVDHSDSHIDSPYTDQNYI